MADRETIIKGLEQCRVGHCDYRCPYASINTGCRNQLSDDAITLLKEQEAIESIDFVDRTEIMANLEGLTWDDWRMYHSDTEVQNIAKSAFDLLIALLKEQEAVEPEVEVLNEIDRLYRCPKCHKCFFYEKQKYCDQCGKKVTWND